MTFIDSVNTVLEQLFKFSLLHPGIREAVQAVYLFWIVALIVMLVAFVLLKNVQWWAILAYLVVVTGGMAVIVIIVGLNNHVPLQEIWRGVMWFSQVGRQYPYTQPIVR